MLLGCIGDDFTGSSDLANTLSKQGMRVTQYSGVPDKEAHPSVEVGVVALKSRSIPAAEAVEQSLRALKWLLAQGCKQILFKYCSTFDSTPEGNIGPVAAALAEALGARKVVVCPAFPGAGRTIYQGNLFVNDRPLNESGMENHPLNPMTDSDIRRWLARQTDMPVGHVPFEKVIQGSDAITKALSVADEAGARLIVVDATSDNDLMEIGKALEGLPFLTGGSGIAMGLPNNFRRQGLVSGEIPEWQGVSGKCVALSGSCSTATRSQVAQHRAQSMPTLEITADDAVAGLLNPKDIAQWALTQEGRPLVFSSADPEVVRKAQEKYGREKVAAAIETLFANIATELAGAGVGRVIVAGGETSGAVVEALELKALEIGPEIAPGVPALRGTLPSGAVVALALKSGNFGGPEFFNEADLILMGS
ncbi:four-carbon acid sugar kinase family protein [Brucella pseudogrignonensis]|uniref:3-oxo-tetronate kinase n=1 Tax=Brucella pseudogrignonensis TaxID=419475 RepID=UPI0028B28CF9|nr:3-oxo-tetronate kinase [Brucella pseudogrignonensis]MDT6942413.1 four-carbon acid sugar kinase family protein [Brucella pseudogrignonensis]